MLVAILCLSAILLLVLFTPCLLRVLTRRPGLTRVAFLHPYCNAGGGGERVLWTWVRCLHQQFNKERVQVIIYTGDDVTLTQLAENVLHRFNIDIEPDRLKLVHISSRWMVEAKRWPRFTLLGQSLASMIMGLECVYRFQTDLVIDSMGYAFALAVFKICSRCKTCSYVHYPIISTDMISMVKSGSAAFNNAEFISKSAAVKHFKLIYYKIFAIIYGLMGRSSDVTLTNSSWTDDHIQKIWKSKSSIVYPPCDVKNFVTLDLTRDSKPPFYLMSVAQFRPEKNHAMQIRALHKLFDNLPTNISRADIKLEIAGSVRHEDDQKILDSLVSLAEELGVSDNVIFSVNVSFDDLRMKLQRAVIGLHTMWNEHFGIGVVEMMASGCVVIAHNSGGPKLDIVSPGTPSTYVDTTSGDVDTDPDTSNTGYLADTPEAYAECIRHVLSMTRGQREAIVTRARASLSRFSEHSFEQGVLKQMKNANLL